MTTELRLDNAQDEEPPRFAIVKEIKPVYHRREDAIAAGVELVNKLASEGNIKVSCKIVEVVAHVAATIQPEVKQYG